MQITRFFRAAAIPALGLLLAACDAYPGGTPASPSLYSMDGRWTTAGDAPVSLVLDLRERRGEITGTGTMTGRASAPAADPVPVTASGLNEGGQLTLRIVSASGMDAVFRGWFTGETRVSGHLGEVSAGFVRRR